MTAEAINLNSKGLHELLQGRLQVAVYSFDANDLLESTEGASRDYVEQGTPLNPGTNAFELFPLLVGLDLSVPKELFYVEFPNGIVVNIYICPKASGYELVMLNSSVQRERHQIIQQVANNVSLERDDLEDENEELSEANKSKSKFISTFSHELKTPLTSILGYSELLLDSSTGASKHHADAIHRNGIYLLNLINNVLEQGRSEISQTIIVTKPTEIQDMIDSINYMVEPLAMKKQLGYSVHVTCPKNLILLLDQQHLSQVLVNLLSNSIKFSETGFVTLEVSYADELLQFIVTDTGIGIPEDELLNIMQPFGRAKHTQHIEGAGIGLSLSSKLVKLMGGHLNMQSELGEGTMVTVSIPAEESRLADENAPKSIANALVMIAEDDEDIFPLIKLYLEGDGIETIVATSPKKVLELLETNQPDLILMDHNLADENGVELTGKILESGYPGKVVMVTATSGEAIVRQAMAAGCVDFISKPVDRDTLLRRVRKQL